MAPPYQQLSLESSDKFTEKCPGRIENKRCGRVPLHKLASTTLNDKEEFEALFKSFLSEFTIYDDTTLSAKGTRLAKVSLCTGCGSGDSVRSFRDNLIQDLRGRNAARGHPAQSSSSSWSTAKARGIKVEMQALRDETYRLAKHDEETLQKLRLSKQELEKYKRVYLTMMGLLTTLSLDVEELESQCAGKKYKYMYNGLKQLVGTATTRSQELADSVEVKDESESDDDELWEFVGDQPS